MCVNSRMLFDTLEIDLFPPLRFANSHSSLQSKSEHRSVGSDLELTHCKRASRRNRKEEEEDENKTEKNINVQTTMYWLNRTAVTDKQRLCNVNCYKNK